MSAFGGEDESDHLDVWEVSWDKGATHWLREKKVRACLMCSAALADACTIYRAACQGANACLPSFMCSCQSRARKLFGNFLWSGWCLYACMHAVKPHIAKGMA